MKVIIMKNGAKLATFEFQKGKALDWITTKGLYIVDKKFIGDDEIWTVRNLP